MADADPHPGASTAVTISDIRMLWEEMTRDNLNGAADHVRNTIWGLTRQGTYASESELMRATVVLTEYLSLLMAHPRVASGLWGRQGALAILHRLISDDAVRKALVVKLRNGYGGSAVHGAAPTAAWVPSVLLHNHYLDFGKSPPTGQQRWIIPTTWPVPIEQTRVDLGDLIGPLHDRLLWDTDLHPPIEASGPEYPLQTLAALIPGQAVDWTWEEILRLAALHPAMAMATILFRRATPIIGLMEALSVLTQEHLDRAPQNGWNLQVSCGGATFAYTPIAEGAEINLAVGAGWLAVLADWLAGCAGAHPMQIPRLSLAAEASLCHGHQWGLGEWQGQMYFRPPQALAQATWPRVIELCTRHQNQSKPRNARS